MIMPVPGVICWMNVFFLWRGVKKGKCLWQLLRNERKNVRIEILDLVCLWKMPSLISLIEIKHLSEEICGRYFKVHAPH